MPEDIRIKTSARTNRKTKRLISRFGVAGWGHLTLFWMEASGERSDGVLTGWTIEDVELAAEWAGTPGEFCQGLLNIGFLDQREDGTLVIHDWEQHQPHVASFIQKSELGRKAAEARWGSSKDMQSTLPGLSAGYSVAEHADRNADPEIRNAPPYLPTSLPSSLPPTTSRRNGPGSGPVGPGPTEIAQLWNQVVGTKLPQVQKLTRERTAKLKSRSSSERTIDWWRTLFERVMRTPFLTGDSDRGWKADFDFVIRSETVVAKILEGAYDRSKVQTSAKPVAGDHYRKAPS